MKALVGLAVVVGLAGIVLGVISLMDGGEAFESQTLELEGASSAEEVEFAVEGIDGSHPFGRNGFSAQREISGDANGEQMITCTPTAGDLVECNGAFILEDGEIEIEGTEVADRDGQATSVIVGGTGAYQGATGSVDSRFGPGDGGAHTYTLDLLIPEE